MNRSYTMDSLPPVYALEESIASLPPAYFSRPASPAPDRTQTASARRGTAMAAIGEDLEMQALPHRTERAAPARLPRAARRERDSRPTAPATARPQAPRNTTLTTTRGYPLFAAGAYRSSAISLVRPNTHWEVTNDEPAPLPFGTRPSERRPWPKVPGSRKRRWLTGLSVALGATVVLGVVLGKQLSNNDSDPDTTDASTAPSNNSGTKTSSSIRSSATSTATPSFAGLVAGTYAVGGVSVFDNCTNAGGFRSCLFSLDAEEFSVTKNRAGYQIQDLTSELTMTVTAQTDPRNLQFTRPMATGQNSDGCALTQQVTYEWVVQSPTLFQGTTSSVQSLASPNDCAPAGGELTCLCRWTGAGAPS